MPVRSRRTGRPTSCGRRGSSTGRRRCTWRRSAGRPRRRRIPAAPRWICPSGHVWPAGCGIRARKRMRSSRRGRGPHTGRSGCSGRGGCSRCPSRMTTARPCRYPPSRSRCGRCCERRGGPTRTRGPREAGPPSSLPGRCHSRRRRPWAAASWPRCWKTPCRIRATPRCTRACGICCSPCPSRTRCWRMRSTCGAWPSSPPGFGRSARSATRSACAMTGCACTPSIPPWTGPPWSPRSAGCRRSRRTRAGPPGWSPARPRPRPGGASSGPRLGRTGRRRPRPGTRSRGRRSWCGTGPTPPARRSGTASPAGANGRGS